MDGIFTLATNNLRYLYLAINLGASIKYNSADLPLVLLYDPYEADIKKFLNGFEYPYEIFDSIKKVPDELFFNGKERCPGKVKLNIDRLSPFDRTVFIDADSQIFFGKDVNKIFEYFDNYNFWVPSPYLSKSIESLEKKEEEFFWFDYDEVSTFFKGSENIGELNTFVYGFDDSKETKNLFDGFRSSFTQIINGEINLTHDGVKDEPSVILEIYQRENVNNFILDDKVLFNHLVNDKKDVVDYEKLKEDYFGITLSGKCVKGDRLFQYEKNNKKYFDALDLPYKTKLRYQIMNLSFDKKRYDLDGRQ